MLHAMQRRADRVGRPMPDVFVRYAHGCKGGAARVAAERERWPEAWDAILATVAAFDAGTLPDPRPGATGWGGTAPGTERDQATIAACVADWTCEVVTGPEATKNVFLREVRR